MGFESWTLTVYNVELPVEKELKFDTWFQINFYL